MQSLSVGTIPGIARSMGQTLSCGELLSHYLNLSSTEVLTQHSSLLPNLLFLKMQLLNISMENKHLAD